MRGVCWEILQSERGWDQLLEDWWLEARMALHRLARVVCRDK